MSILRRGDRRFFYQLFPKTGNRKKVRRKGITNDTQTIMGLVRKRYITKAVRVIDKDIKVLEMAIKHCNELKFVEYENAEIVPWDNLIITYDMKDGGFDAKIIDAMIQGWLL